MNQLVLAVAAFVGTHFLLSHPLRAPLVAKLGEKGFSGLYSVIALATFYWVYVAFSGAPTGDYFWTPGESLWGVASLLMLVASILFAGSFVGNPAMPTPTAKADAAKPLHGVFHLSHDPLTTPLATACRQTSCRGRALATLQATETHQQNVVRPTLQLAP